MTFFIGMAMTFVGMTPAVVHAFWCAALQEHTLRFWSWTWSAGDEPVEPLELRERWSEAREWAREDFNSLCDRLSVRRTRTA